MSKLLRAGPTALAAVRDRPEPARVIAWWRSSPLTTHEQAILHACLAAHHAAAQRENISTSVLHAALQGSGSLPQALCAAILSTGGVHAPLIQTHALLSCDDAPAVAAAMLDHGARVPGWGSSFAKGAPDPLLDEIAQYHDLGLVTGVLHRRGLMLYPNLSAYTAATAITLGIPAEGCLWLLIQGRLAAWVALCSGRVD
jgi:hypothetical protein